MGRLIVALIAEDEECELVCALERAGAAAVARDAGDVAGVGPLGVDVGTELCASPEVLIDFSLPGPCLERLDECARHGVAAVVGTTGFDAGEKEQLENFGGQIPLLVAPNMSVGVNLMFRLAAQVAAMLGDNYDIEIIESHHRHKKDAPSGTAVKIADTICKAMHRNPEDVLDYGREGIVGERPRARIGVHAVRGGDIVGEHTVIYAGEGERLELTHRAGSRNVFAAGAINAAKFIRDRQPGLYGMQDLLGS